MYEYNLLPQTLLWSIECLLLLSTSWGDITQLEIDGPDCFGSYVRVVLTASFQNSSCRPASFNMERILTSAVQIFLLAAPFLSDEAVTVD